MHFENRFFQNRQSFLNRDLKYQKTMIRTELYGKLKVENDQKVASALKTHSIYRDYLLTISKFQLYERRWRTDKQTSLM